MAANTKVPLLFDCRLHLAIFLPYAAICQLRPGRIFGEQTRKVKLRENYIFPQLTTQLLTFHPKIAAKLSDISFSLATRQNRSQTEREKSILQDFFLIERTEDGK